MSKKIINPILSGFYPDPSVCVANGRFYLVNSSFSYFPGLPIFESEDCCSWKQIGNIIDRPSQLDFSGQGVSRGLFAPTIRYNNGKFYCICTQVDKIGNFLLLRTILKGLGLIQLLLMVLLVLTLLCFLMMMELFGTLEQDLLQKV